MAYLHCHTKNCHWSQDDFWNWEWKGLLKFWKWSSRPFGYNPFSLILEDFACWIKPRYTEFDSGWCKENGFKNPVFSWRLMIWEWKRHLKKLFTMKYWTWESWKKAKDTAICPKCGRRNWDID